LDVLAKDGSIKVEQRIVTLAELHDADEVWVTSSSKEIVPVISVDGVPVANGDIGDVWLAAQTLFSAGKSNY
jgi:D-alanine transaminase